MRKWVVRTLPVVVGSGLLVSVSFGQTPMAEEGASEAKKPSLMSRFLTTTGLKKDEKTETPAGKAEKKTPSPAQPQLVESAQIIMDAERAIWLRRTEVCDKLRMIALETGDEKLEKMAFQLDQMAMDVFLKRTSHLATSVSGASDEEAVLNSKFGPSSNAGVTANRKLPGETGSNGQVAARKENQ